MLDNSIGLVYGAAGGAATNTYTVSLTDTDDGRSKRRLALGGGEFVDLTISHEETRGKDGIVSDRHLVRIDHTIPDPAVSTAPPVVVSVYEVLVSPRRYDVTPTHLGQLHTALRNLLKDGTTMDGVSDSDAILARISSGEL